jgi:outer membrane translocation and assembly module TamA
MAHICLSTIFHHSMAGNPALRQGKPGFGVGFGYGIHFNTNIGQIRVDYAVNAFSRKTVYFGIHSGGGS